MTSSMSSLQFQGKAEAGSVIPIVIPLVSVVGAVLLIVIAIYIVRRRMKRQTLNIQTTRTTVEMVSYTLP